MTIFTNGLILSTDYPIHPLFFRPYQQPLYLLHIMPLVWKLCFLFCSSVTEKSIYLFLGLHMLFTEIVHVLIYANMTLLQHQVHHRSFQSRMFQQNPLKSMLTWKLPGLHQLNRMAYSFSMNSVLWEAKLKKYVIIQKLINWISFLMI